MGNLYEVLQVSPDANVEVIRAAYRTLARAQHPDVNPDPNATRYMRRLNAAYQILSDPARRARYDAERVRVAPAARPATPTPAVRPSVQVARRRAHPEHRRGAEAAVAAALPPSPARLGLLVLLLVAIAATAVVCLWVLGNVLQESSPYDLHLDAAAQPILNRA